MQQPLSNAAACLKTPLGFLHLGQHHGGIKSWAPFRAIIDREPVLTLSSDYIATHTLSHVPIPISADVSHEATGTYSSYVRASQEYIITNTFVL